MKNNVMPPAPETSKAKKRRKRKKSLWREIGEWVFSLAAAAVIVLLLQSFVFTLIRVDGHSMESTLADGERLFVTVADVRLGLLERGDVVICHYPNRGRTFFVKRAVGVPGDTVYRENGVTHISYEAIGENGERVIIDHALDADTSTSSPRDDYGPYVLGDDEYFVVGDNRAPYKSHDSRDWNDSDPSNDVGPITSSMITGHVRCVIWPLNSIRTVE